MMPMREGLVTSCSTKQVCPCSARQARYSYEAKLNPQAAESIGTLPSGSRPAPQEEGVVPEVGPG